MRKSTTTLLCPTLLFCMVSAGMGEALPLRESTIVEVINSVEVLAGDEMTASAAEPGQLFRAPDFLQTGRRARARLEAEDGTVTRVGSNTLFSFADEDRTINLQRGSLLFHSPEGRGGGNIVTASATAAVLGTTVVVVATQDGGFKVLVLEGTASVTFADGTTRILGAGQMTFVQPGRPETAGAGPVLNFDLETLSENSALIQGFDQPLASQGDILQAIQRQAQDVSSGALNETGTMILFADGDTVIGLDFSESGNLPRITQESREGSAAGGTGVNGGAANGAGGGEPTAGPAASTPAEDTATPINPELTRLRTAAATDHTLSGNVFPENAFFGPPGVDVPEGEFATRPDPSNFQGFMGRSILFQDGMTDVSGIALPNEVTRVLIFAFDSIGFAGNQEFIGFNGMTDFTLETDGSLDVPEDSNFSVQGNDPVYWDLIAADDISLSYNSFQNNTGGSLHIESTQGSLIASNSNFNAENKVFLGAKNLVQLNAGSIQANFVEIRAGGNIEVTNTNFSQPYYQFASEWSDTEVKMVAGNWLTLSGVSLYGFDRVRMSADTIALSNVNFSSYSSVIDLRSTVGMLAPDPNTGRTPLPGYVNFISNVMVDGYIPAQDEVAPSAGGSATGPALINIAPR